MSLICRRLLNQGFFRSNLFAQGSRISANPCNRSLHKKTGAINFTWGQRIFKGFSMVVIAEITCLGVAYIQWTIMNRDPDYRYTMTQSSMGSKMLEGYYAFGEYMDPSNKIREHDLKLWRTQGRNI